MLHRHVFIYIYIKSKGIYQLENLMSNGSSRHNFLDFYIYLCIYIYIRMHISNTLHYWMDLLKIKPSKIIMICTDSACMCTSHYHSNSEMKNGILIRQKHWLFKVVPYTSGNIWSARLILLFFFTVCLNIWYPL